MGCTRPAISHVKTDEDLREVYMVHSKTGIYLDDLETDRIRSAADDTMYPHGYILVNNEKRDGCAIRNETVRRGALLIRNTVRDVLKLHILTMSLVSSTFWRYCRSIRR